MLRSVSLEDRTREKQTKTGKEKEVPIPKKLGDIHWPQFADVEMEMIIMLTSPSPCD